jgi:hypothetical protein
MPWRWIATLRYVRSLSYATVFTRLIVFYLGCKLHTLGTSAATVLMRSARSMLSDNLFDGTNQWFKSKGDDPVHPLTYTVGIRNQE